MKTINLPVSQLHNYADNPRMIDENGMELLKQSITDFPEMLEAQPLIVSNRTGQYVVLGGNQRLESARQLGLESLPCIVVSGWSEDMERRAVITANTHFGNKFDPLALANEIWAQYNLPEWGVEPELLAEWENAVESADWNGLDKEESEARQIDPENLTDDFSLKEGDRAPFQQITFQLADQQATDIKNAIETIKKTDEYKYQETYGNENSNGNAIYLIVKEWEEQRI